MNRTTTPSIPCDDLLALGRPALLLMAIAALSSCRAAPAPEPRPPVVFDASQALPVIGLGEGLPTPATASNLPSDIEERFNNGLALSPYEKSVLDLRRSRAARQPAGLGAEESEGEADQRTDPQASSPLRHVVVWGPVAPPPSSEPTAYAGPGSADASEQAAAPSAPSVENTGETAPAAQHAAEVTPPVLRLADLITPLKSQLAMQAADSNSPLREHLVAASLLMLDNQRRTDPATLHDLTDREREVLRAYQDYFARVGEALRSGGGVDAIVKEAKAIATSLASEGQLCVPEFRLCSRVTNFGLFDEIATYKFPAMRPTPLLTYVEIEGFRSVPGGDGKYITRVRHELELFSESDGELVYSWPAAPAEDICGKVRRDFFLPRQIQLPSNLTVGRYRLKVRIVDEQSQQQAESVVAFSIIAGGDVAIGK